MPDLAEYEGHVVKVLFLEDRMHEAYLRHASYRMAYLANS